MSLVRRNGLLCVHLESKGTRENGGQEHGIAPYKGATIGQKCAATLGESGLACRCLEQSVTAVSRQWKVMIGSMRSTYAYHFEVGESN